MQWLILTLLLIPAIEIGIFIWIGGLIGPWWVVWIILLTGLLGIWLAKYNGAENWKKARQVMDQGRAPTEQIVDGICIFVGGVFLLTPGLFTDAIGFALVLPWSRTPFKRIIYRWIKKFLDRQNGTIIFKRW